MDFRTTIHIADNMGIMHHSDRFMMLGSCFSDNIGGKLHQAMIDVNVNPFGTLYNPMSIASSVNRIIDVVPERGIDLFQGSGVWNSYNFHSRYSLADKEATLTLMNEQIAKAHEHLKSCHTLVVTLGTAVVYRLKETSLVVANCHKVPQHNFTRRMASVDEITEALSAMVERLHEFNPQLRILFTVSPIRHIADGLEVNSLVDDRRDPIKSSYAAANYLKDLYKVFGDWNLVIAAYNCGPDQINKAIHRAKGSKDYWQIYPYLPKETRGYVPAFIAANYIMTYYCEHNICPMTTRLPAKTDTVMVDRNVHLEQIAAVCNIDIEQLRTLNPSYRRDIAPGATKLSAIRLPQTEVGKFIDMQDSIYAYNAEALFTKRATVEVNDNTPTYTRSSSSRSKSKKRTSRRGKTVTIKSGQTLSEIAKRNGTTVAKLKKLNGLKGTNIRAGKKLRVR